MLLEVDGLDEPWNGIKVPTSSWEGDLGDLEEDDVPQALHWILSPSEIRTYDTSSIGNVNRNATSAITRGETDKDSDADDDNGDDGLGNEFIGDDDEEDGEHGDAAKGGDGEYEGKEKVRIVRKLSLQFFRSKLVEHFDIKFKRGEIVWPCRRGSRPIPYVDHTC